MIQDMDSEAWIIRVSRSSSTWESVWENCAAVISPTLFAGVTVWKTFNMLSIVIRAWASPSPEFRNAVQPLVTWVA